MYSTTEMAKKLGVSIQTLRNWDKNKTLVAHRKPSGHMFYLHDQFLEVSGNNKYKRTGTDLDAVVGKVVLITGGTGSLGHAVTRRICDVAKKVIIFSRCELKQANMQIKFSDKTNIRYMIGDIRDKDRLVRALRGVDVCIHAACMKRVETCTYNPLEAVKSNILGSMNVLEACIENKVPKSLLVSTDKACLDFYSRITLSDGSTRKIGEVVENKEKLDILTFDKEQNKFVSAKITNWFKNKRLDREYFDVSFKNARRYSNHRTKSRVTEDHLFLTQNRGWVEAKELLETDLLVTDYLSPSDGQMSLLCGLLMGDGNISLKKGKNNNSRKAVFRYGQSEDKAESVELFKKSLGSLGVGQIGISKKSERKPYIQRFHTFNIKASPALTELYNKFYPSGIKEVPRDMIEKYFSPVMLAAWINDDGCMSYDNLRIATHSFCKDDVDWLVEFFSGRGFKCWTYPCKYEDKIYYELRFDVQATRKIHSLISRLFPQCCSHKLSKKFRGCFDDSLWNLGEPKPFIDHPVIRKSARKSKYVYCIEVEKTNNFVSAGMVVHNCSPATLYGGTKFVAEQIFINGNNYSTRDCAFTSTRYGNVYASNGSVRQLFEDQAKKFNKVKVTHKDMTRFFMSMDDAVDLNLFALNNTIGGEIFIPKIKGTTIMSFAETFAPGVPVEFIGLRGHEKIHEDLISSTEMLYVVDMGKYYKVVPPGVTDQALGWDVGYPDEPKTKPFKYTSNTVDQFTTEELKELDN